MLKLSLAAALVYGASAISTDAKGQASFDPIADLFGEKAAKEIIELMKVPSDQEIQRISNYWDSEKN